MEGQDIRGLIEAYSQVYETPEVLSEEVEDLHEVPNPARDAAQAKAYAADQQRISKLPTSGKGVSGNVKVQTRDRSGQASGYRQYYKSSSDGKMYANYNDAAAARQSRLNTLSKAQSDIKKAAPGIILPGDPRLKKPSAPAAPAKPGSNAPTPARPSAAPKPSAAPAAAKPAAPAPAKPAGSAMDQWAKANPKLAAAKAERDRTRGTSATTNPLMKDMKSSLPAPKSPAPSTAKTGFDLAKKGVNLAADVDIFDLVKGHLLDEGYAETEENALVMMANMSEEWRKSILEAHGIELDEAQRARENPEGHDKEEKKKYEPVRGEKTPMPPRGDKRREDFEKWYAKHVR